MKKVLYILGLTSVVFLLSAAEQKASFSFRLFDHDLAKSFFVKIFDGETILEALQRANIENVYKITADLYEDLYIAENNSHSNKIRLDTRWVWQGKEPSGRYKPDLIKDFLRSGTYLMLFQDMNDQGVQRYQGAAAMQLQPYYFDGRIVEEYDAHNVFPDDQEDNVENDESGIDDDDE